MPHLPHTYIIEVKRHPDSILEIWYKRPIPEITFEIAKKAVEERMQHQGSSFCHVLLHAEDLLKATPEAQKYLSSPDGLKGVASAAIVYNSVTAMIVHNFVSLFSKTPVSIKRFTNTEDALKWLRLQAIKSGPLKSLEAIRTIVAEAVQNNSDPTEKRIMEFALNALQNPPQLTPTQYEVLQHLVAGLSSKEIAVITKNSIRTIENHRSALLKALLARNTAELIAAATKFGLVRTK